MFHSTVLAIRNATNGLFVACFVKNVLEIYSRNKWSMKQ